MQQAGFSSPSLYDVGTFYNRLAKMILISIHRKQFMKTYENHVFIITKYPYSDTHTEEQNINFTLFEHHLSNVMKTTDSMNEKFKVNSILFIELVGTFMCPIIFSYTKTKMQITVFVFATEMVQSLYYLSPKFQASSHLLWLYIPV